MKHRLGRVSVLMVALILVVGVMGAGFASWTDSLVVNGIVTTADFDVGIVDIIAIGESGELYDAGPNYEEDGGVMYPQNSPVDGTADPQFGSATNVEGKNVASTNSYNIGDPRFTKDLMVDTGAVMEDVPFYGAIREEIHNAYPWYASGVAFAIGNAGSIPLHIVNVDFEPVGISDCSILQWLMLDTWEAWVYPADEPRVLVGSGSGVAELEYLLSGWSAAGQGNPFQLEPCHTLYLELFWHFEQDVYIDDVLTVMPQNADCEFLITIDAEQWAE